MAVFFSESQEASLAGLIESTNYQVATMRSCEHPSNCSEFRSFSPKKLNKMYYFIELVNPTFVQMYADFSSQFSF